MGRRRPVPPDVEFPISPAEAPLPLLIILVVIWAVLGKPFYMVAPDEVGVVTTFGRMTSEAGPGLHFKFPRPVQRAYTPRVREAKRLEVGFRTVDAGPPASYRDPSNSREMRAEAEMLTGDENMVMSSLIVQYQVRNAHDYLFNLPDPDGALHDLVQAVERQVVGDRPIDDVLTVGKTEIQQEMHTRLQELADRYGIGVTVIAVKLQDVQPPPEVAGAFKDVATAKEDRSQIINKAEGYKNEQLPKARGEAARMLRDAEAYRETRIANAQGDVARFLALAAEHAKAPEVTEKRLYLETMATVLKRARKTIVDKEAGVLNLNQLQPAGGTP